MTSISASWILFNTALLSVKVTCYDRISYTLWDAPRQTTSRTRWHQPSPFILAQKWVNVKVFPERTSDLLQNPMQSIADVECKLEREFRERNFAQKKPNTLQRCSSVSQLNIALFATWSKVVKQLIMPVSKQAWSAGICQPASPLWDVPRTATSGKRFFYHLPQEEIYQGSVSRTLAEPPRSPM